MKKLLLLITLLVIPPFTTVQAQQAVPFAGDRVVTVMTQNLYSGVDDVSSEEVRQS